MRTQISALFAVALAGCGPATSPRNAIEPSPTSYRPIDGYRDIKLGSSFEAAIGSIDTSILNSYGLRECFSDLAISGCSVGRKSDDSVYEIRDGISYNLGLYFNKHDRLTDLTLNYHREGRITAEQCRDVFGRTIDWVTKDYGPVDWRRRAAKPEPDAGKSDLLLRTPAGNSFAILKPDRNGSYVSHFLFSDPNSWESRSVDGTEQLFNRKRHLTIFSSFLVVDRKPICDIDLRFSEPGDVERPAYRDTLSSAERF